MIRRTLDNMMKVDVFESVTQAETQNGLPAEPMYRYEFSPTYAKPETLSLPSRPFVSLLFIPLLPLVPLAALTINPDAFSRKRGPTVLAWAGQAKCL